MAGNDHLGQCRSDTEKRGQTRLSEKYAMAKLNIGSSASDATRHDIAPDLTGTGPTVALLSNGRYSVMVTAAGSRLAALGGTWT